VSIDGLTFPANTTTAYTASNKTHLDLATVLAFWEYGKSIWESGRSLNYADYVRHARDVRKSGFVLILDVEGLRDYLRGQSEGEGKVDQKALQSAPESKGPVIRTTALASEEESFSVARAMAAEVTFKTRRSTLECGRALKDDTYKLILDTSDAAGKGVRGGESSDGGNKRGASSTSSSSATTAASSKRPRPSGDELLASIKGTPIIIVPSAPTSIITIYNAKQLLEEGSYVKAEDARLAHGDAEKPTKVSISRRDGAGRSCKYYIIDNPTLLTGADWLKVVAVFAAGSEWQFKGWKWGSKGKGEAPDITPVQLFSRSESHKRRGRYAVRVGM